VSFGIRNLKFVILMNFSAISDRTAFGKFLRLPLCLIPPGTAMPILQGALRHKKWIVGSGNHGYWLGSYEREKCRIFERTVTEGSTVFDVGAHAGFYSLLAASLVGPRGKVFAFEPSPRNLRYLRQHLQMNTSTNVQVIDAAVSNRTGMAWWEEGVNSSTGHLLRQDVAPAGAPVAARRPRFRVRTLSLDQTIARGELPAPDYMKIDVEGAEELVLAGARSLLRCAHPTLFLATHGRDLHTRCCKFLASLGYRLETVSPNKAAGVLDSDEILAMWNQRS